jgi:hypothetical protein
MVPPYCGVPRLSHHGPVDVVEATTPVDVAADVGEVGVDELVGVIDVAKVDVVEVGAMVDVEVVDVVDELLQDDNTSDVTKRKASDTRIIPLFMCTFLFLLFIFFFNILIYRLLSTRVVLPLARYPQGS